MTVEKIGWGQEERDEMERLWRWVPVDEEEC